MKLQYQAKNSGGQVLTGELEAASLAEGRLLLRRQGLFLLSLLPLGNMAKSTATTAARPRHGRVRSAELVTMMSQLTIMMQSGVALAEALEHLSQTSRSAALRAVLHDLHTDVTSGTSLSQALRKHPDVFDEAFVAGIAAGEQSGNIIQVLERLSTLLRNEKRLRTSIWAMLTYPLLLCGVMGVVLLGLVFFVLPQFKQVFLGFGHPAPPLTQFMLDAGDFARSNIWAFVAAGVALVLGLIYFCQQPIARRWWDHVLMHAIVVRNAARTLSSGRCFFLLGTMLQSGVPLLDCLRLGRSASRSQIFRSLFDRMEEDLIHGRGISGALATADFLPSGAAQMIATAERSGKLGPVMLTIGQYYEEEGETAVRNIVKLAEPALIVLLGVIVATVVMSIMLPLFDASTMVQ